MNLFPLSNCNRAKKEHLTKTKQHGTLIEVFVVALKYSCFPNICLERLTPYPSVSEGLLYTHNVTIKGLQTCTPAILPDLLYKGMDFASHTLTLLPYSKAAETVVKDGYGHTPLQCMVGVCLVLFYAPK